MTDERDVSRRSLMKAGVAAGLLPFAGGIGPLEAQPREQAPSGSADEGNAGGVLLFFNDEEARFVRAAVDRLIPADETWPGAVGAGVLTYIDRQLASAYGAGAKMYLTGPWQPDAPPQHGYQLRHAPAELYRVGIEETRAACRERMGREFHDLAAQEQDGFLSSVESGDVALPSLPAPVFFETLLANTVEGFFADPAYGGNRDMIGWRMVGFPGAYAQYLELVGVHGVAFVREPIAIGNHDARRHHIAAHGRGG